MDPRLLAWARRSARRATLPPLWLFTDAARLPDPRLAVARLPAGLAGVVLRHDSAPDRASLGRDLARICRRRRLLLVVAGDARLADALRAGLHVRAGRLTQPRRPRHQPMTSSAHGMAELVRARRLGVDLVFLSPVFPTASHPGAPALGAARWTRLARASGLPVAALGGIDGASVRRLSRQECRAIGAIGALA